MFKILSLLLVVCSAFSQTSLDGDITIYTEYNGYNFIALDGRESLRNNNQRIIKKRAELICKKLDGNLFDFKTIAKNISSSRGEYGMALTRDGDFKRYYVEPFMPCFDCIFEPYVMFVSVSCEDSLY